MNLLSAFAIINSTLCRTGSVNVFKKLMEYQKKQKQESESIPFLMSQNFFSVQDATDSGGSYETPLIIAAQHNRRDMLKFLMSESKLQGSPNSEGITPLMVSLKEGNTDIVQLLLCRNSIESKAAKSLLEEKDNDEKNVFHYACESRKPAEMTQILVEVTSRVYQHTRVSAFLYCFMK